MKNMLQLYFTLLIKNILLRDFFEWVSDWDLFFLLRWQAPVLWSNGFLKLSQQRSSPLFCLRKGCTRPPQLCFYRVLPSAAEDPRESDRRMPEDFSASSLWMGISIPRNRAPMPKGAAEDLRREAATLLADCGNAEQLWYVYCRVLALPNGRHGAGIRWILDRFTTALFYETWAEKVPGRCNDLQNMCMKIRILIRYTFFYTVYIFFERTWLDFIQCQPENQCHRNPPPKKKIGLFLLSTGWASLKPEHDRPEPSSVNSYHRRNHKPLVALTLFCIISPSNFIQFSFFWLRFTRVLVITPHPYPFSACPPDAKSLFWKAS